jgi:hypothetical protein
VREYQGQLSFGHVLDMIMLFGWSLRALKRQQFDKSTVRTMSCVGLCGARQRPFNGVTGLRGQ